MVTQAAVTLRTDLLSDVYTGATLDTFLATSTNVAPYNELLSSAADIELLVGSEFAFTNAIIDSSTGWTLLSRVDTALRAIANSDYATNIMAGTGFGDKFKDFFDPDYSRFSDHYQNIPANLARIKKQVNKSGSTLNRQIYTSNGSFTFSGTLYAVSVFGVGGGAGGDAGSINDGGGAGGLKTYNFTPAEIALFSSPESVVRGNGGASSTSGQQQKAGQASTMDVFSIAGGLANSRTGGGTTDGSIDDVIFDPKFAVWQPTNVEIQGGDGGFGTSTLGERATRGQEVLVNTAGLPGYVEGGDRSISGTRGMGYLAGGGGSIRASSSYTTDYTIFVENIGAGGGGAPYGGGSIGTSLQGAVGIMIVYWIED